MASMLPWNRPGARGEPTSAITSTVMSVGVMPMSVDCRVTLAHELGAVDVVGAAAAAVVGAAMAAVDLLELLREHPAATTHAATNTESANDRFTGPPDRKLPTDQHVSHVRPGVQVNTAGRASAGSRKPTNLNPGQTVKRHHGSTGPSPAAP